MDLVADILDGDPFNGLGKPKALKYFPEFLRIDQINQLG
jgi:hypothetical protein